MISFLATLSIFMLIFALYECIRLTPEEINARVENMDTPRPDEKRNTFLDIDDKGFME